MLPRLAALVPAGPTLRRWRRLLRRRRRSLMAALAALSLLTILQALAPAQPATVDVLVSARDLPGGTLLVGADLALARLPPSALPSGAVTAGEVLGRTLAAPLRRGVALTDVALVGSALAASLSRSLVEAPVRLADSEVAALLRVGDLVDVLAAPADPGGGGAASVVASGVRVLAVPVPEQDSSLSQGALIVLATSRRTALTLAADAVADRLSVTVLRP